MMNEVITFWKSQWASWSEHWQRWNCPKSSSWFSGRTSTKDSANQCVNSWVHDNPSFTWTNVGLNRYPIWVRAWVNSASSMNPLRSLSIASNIPFHWLMYEKRAPNSWMLMVPDLSLSNILIIILHASSLKWLMFPLTKALCNSFASICPLLSWSTAWNHWAIWGSTLKWKNHYQDNIL